VKLLEGKRTAETCMQWADGEIHGERTYFNTKPRGRAHDSAQCRTEVAPASSGKFPSGGTLRHWRSVMA